MNTLASEANLSTKKAFAIIVASVALVAGVLGAGIFKQTHDDPCARAFQISEQVIGLNTELLSSSGNGITAVRNGDETSARKYADEMSVTIDKLEKIRPDYNTAAQACRREKQ